MNRSRGAILWVSAFFALGIAAFAQEIPNDPNALPKMIGGQKSTSSTVTVTGKVTVDRLPPDRPRPLISVVVYSSGRLVVRQRVNENGSYSLTEVPREGAMMIVEVDNAEVANRQIIASPARVIYQDFSISYPHIDAARSKATVISVAAAYKRSRENQLRFERAEEEISKGKSDKAIELLKAIVADDPKDHFAWTQMGNSYFLKKDLINAQEAYLNAIAIQPNYLQPLVNLGRLYLMRSNYDSAIDILTKAVAAEPMSAIAQQFLGEAYLGIKKGSLAVGHLNEAIRLAPVEMAEVHLRLAALYNGAGLKPRAAAEYQKFLEKVPAYQKRDELKKYIAENPPSQ